MYRLRLFKILFIHSPKLLKRFFLLMFRKNSKLQFEYTIKNEDHKNLNLLKNQIAIELVVKNGFVIRVGKRYIPLLREQTHLTINVPMIEQGVEINLKVLGFFKSIKAVIPLDRNGVYVNNPFLSKSKLISNLEVQLKKGKTSLRDKTFSPQMQIATMKTMPKLFTSTQLITPTNQLRKITEPSFKHDIEKLEFKLNREL